MTTLQRTMLHSVMLTVLLSAGLLLSALFSPAAYAHAGSHATTHAGHGPAGHISSAVQSPEAATPAVNAENIAATFLTAAPDAYAGHSSSHHHTSDTTCNDRDCHAPGHCPSGSVASAPFLHMFWPARETASLPAYLAPADANAGVDALKRPPRS